MLISSFAYICILSRGRVGVGGKGWEVFDPATPAVLLLKSVILLAWNLSLFHEVKGMDKSLRKM